MIRQLSKEQAAIIGAYTGVLCGPFSELHEYIEQILGRPVWTHELADKKTNEKIKAAAKPDFLTLCRELKETEQ